MKAVIFWSMVYLAFIVPASAQQSVSVCQTILNEANARFIATAENADKKIAELQKQVDDLKAEYEPKPSEKK